MSFSEGLAEAVKDAFCAITGTGTQVAALFGAMTPGEGDDNLIEFGRQMHLLLCDEPPPVPPPPVFPPGACPVPYRIESRYVTELGAEQVPGLQVYACNSESPIFGPIVGPIRETTPGGEEWVIYGSDGGGGTVRAPVSTTFFPPSVNIAQPSLTLSRCDGGADECGTPERPQPPDEWNVEGDTIVFTPPGGSPIEVPVEITFAVPVFNIDGTVSIPVSVEVGVNPEFNFEVPIEVNFNLPSGDVTPRIPPGPDVPDDRPPPGSKPGDYIPTGPGGTPPAGGGNGDGNPPPPPPDTSIVTVIRGATVFVDVVGPGLTEVFPQNESTPSMFLPDLGSVFFGCKVGNFTWWEGPHRVQTRRALVPCEWEGGAISIRWLPRPGVFAGVTPVTSVRELPRREL